MPLCCQTAPGLPTSPYAGPFPTVCPVVTAVELRGQPKRYGHIAHLAQDSPDFPPLPACLDLTFGSIPVEAVTWGAEEGGGFKRQLKP